jgi:hypothetical protein
MQQVINMNMIRNVSKQDLDNFLPFLNILPAKGYGAMHQSITLLGQPKKARQ